ncbi:hypothetical protein VTK73DRAFT_1842 [Phialemonium thermophilum]|uniref:PHD-type domain-containing protein n=1 Tax=Phialemonium thermophilum TaxID=223376 RepID=A0ABR3X802_9PEZI
MSSSSTRATRSRFSSPQVQTQTNGSAAASSSKSASADGQNGQKSFMQRWLEPPVQVKASYQDAGLVRRGVVEGMAPLGTMPKVGIFRKIATPTETHHATPTRKIILKRPAAAAAAAPSTPTPAPAGNVAEDDTEEEEEEDEEDELVAADEDESRAVVDEGDVFSRRSLTSRDADEDWAPGKARASGYKQQQHSARRSLPRTSISGPATGSAGFRAQHGAAAQSGASQATEGARDVKELQDLADRVVEFAVEEALRHFRYPTAWALRTLYDENYGNAEFLTMLQEVYSQRASAETLAEFVRLMHDKKREGKKDNKGCYYFIPPATNSRFTPHKPKRAPYGNLVRIEMPKLQFDPPSEPKPAGQPEDKPGDEEEEQKSHHEQADGRAKKRRRSSKHTDSPAKMSATHGHSARGKTDSPLRRKTRVNSLSSSSSLSPARSMTPPDEIAEEDEKETEATDIFEVPPSRSSPGAGGDSAPPAAASKSSASSTSAATTAHEPIAKRRRSTAKKHGDVSPVTTTATTTPSSPTTRQQRSASSTTTTTTTTAAAAAAAASASTSGMPAIIEPPVLSDLAPFPSSKKKGSAKDHDAYVFPSKVGTLDENDKKLRLRQRAKNVTNGVVPVPESFSRAPTAGDRRGSAGLSSSYVTPTTRSRTSLPEKSLGPATRATRSSLKRSHDDAAGEDSTSPTAVQFAGSEAASTAADSRAGTPSLRPAKRARTGLRVKTSPMKKKAGTSAGIPRASGERSSPAVNGNVTKEDDNDDYCSSCGGNGELVCCDGCTRSFHLTCVDPPLHEDRMPAEWFCNVCLSTRFPASFPAHRGAFALLLDNLDAKNSSAFRLPAEIRDYFEGVRTGVDGEYEEIVAVTKPSRRRKGEDDQIPDFFRLRDNEGGSVICHMCQKATSENRPIIPCSLCGLWWHIDCLDPPLANPPVLRNWRCPCHVDDLLVKIPGALGPAHKFRKIKGAPAITPAFRRGNINNGYIDVVPDDSDDESGWKDVNTFGKLYKLPEKGIKLDFFSRIRENRKGKPIAPLANRFPVSLGAHAPQPLNSRSLDEQQAALNLAWLSGHDASAVDALVDALIAEADPTVVSLIARGNPTHIKNGALDQIDVQSLRAMLAQMEQLSNRIKSVLHDRSGAEEAPATRETSPSKEGPNTTARAGAKGDAARASMGRGAHCLAAVNGDVDVEDDGKKNLPSPAATEEVTTWTQVEEKEKPVGKTIAVADPGLAEPVAEEATGNNANAVVADGTEEDDEEDGDEDDGEDTAADNSSLPPTRTDEKLQRVEADGNVVMDHGPSSDDKTAVEETVNGV